MKVLVNGVETPVVYSDPQFPEASLTAEGGKAKDYSPAVWPKVQYRTACGSEPARVVLLDPRDDQIQAGRIPMNAEVKEDAIAYFGIKASV